MPLKAEIYSVYDIPKEFLPKSNSNDTHRNWWEIDSKTKAHAKFCLPLLMANGIGYTLVSPITFTVDWDGQPDTDAMVIVHESAPHAFVDNHSTRGGFTVQSHMVIRTPENVFTLVKGIPNRRCPFTVMEALIETWWNPSTFGIVSLCNAKGKFTIRQGQPLAQIVFVHKDQVIGTELEFKGPASGKIPNYDNLMSRRRNYTQKELFYFRGSIPNAPESKNDSPYEGPHYKPVDLRINTFTPALEKKK